jgi:hypothetical protein
MLRVGSEYGPEGDFLSHSSWQALLGYFPSQPNGELGPQNGKGMVDAVVGPRARSVLYLQLRGTQPMQSTIQAEANAAGGEEGLSSNGGAPTTLHRAGGDTLVLRNVNQIDATEEDVMAFARTFSAPLEEESGQRGEVANRATSPSQESAPLFSTGFAVGVRSYFPPLPLRRRVSAMEEHPTNGALSEPQGRSGQVGGEGELPVGFHFGPMQYFLVDKRTLKQYEASAFVPPSGGTGKNSSLGKGNTVPLSAEPTCPKGHPLQLYTSSSWSCDRCSYRSKGTFDSSFACRSCNFDVCHDCFLKMI